MAKRARVAVVRTTPQRVLEDYARVLELSGCGALLRDAGNVVAYGNLTWSRYFPGGSSPPWQLDGVAHLARGKSTWRWVAGTGHTGRPRRGARDACWPAALERHGQTFEPLARTEILHYPQGKRLMVLDEIFPTGLPVPRTALRGSVAVHLPTLKTHGLVGLAGAIENGWPSWLPAGGGAAAAHPHEVLVDLLTLQLETHQAVCAVMDATIAGDGAGPRTVEPKETNVLLASTDPVALDAVAARLAGMDPFSVRYLALAYALGLGCADTEEIELAGDDVPPGELHLRARRPPSALARTVLEELRLQGLEDWIFRRRWLTPASTLYYDLLWYHSVGKSRLRTFHQSAWGRLFASYAARQR